MKPVNALLLGAGNRGGNVYAGYARNNPGMLKITGVAEPDTVKRERIRNEHQIPPESVFVTWEDAFKRPLTADAVIIATQDRMHTGPLTAAMERNVAILCEKPIVTSLEECRRIEQSTAGFTRPFMIAHVLKYTPFFSTIKKLLSSGKIGTLIGIDLIEHIGHIHYSHSFTRGNWRNSDESSPVILAKSCHDMDILYWLAASPCESLHSFGEQRYFKAENAPAGAPSRCLDGCPQQTSCPYFAPKVYGDGGADWMISALTTDTSPEGRLAALQTGPYGRCVFHCDNNVADHQTVSMRFKNGVMANFTMSAFTAEIHRSISLFGTTGEIEGDMEAGTIRVSDFSSGNVETIAPGRVTGGHAGGDSHFITDFVRMVRDGGGEARNMIRDSFESHYMAFAAEKSRLEGAKAIRLADFKQGNG